MSLRYEWTWDIANTGATAVVAQDSGDPFEIRFTTGTYGHTSIATVDDIEGNAVARYAAYTAFADALEDELNDASSETYTVTWNGTTGYTIACTDSFSLTFDSGFTLGSAAEGTRMRQILGMSGNRSSSTSYSSQVRPWYLIIPTIQGRSQMSDEHEPEGLMFEAGADDGSAYQVSKDSVEVWSEWHQQAETDTAPSTFSDVGTPVYRRHATSAVPWVYQDAWRHMREGDHPFLVVDGSEQAVHQIRGDGAAFKPVRFGASDYPLWSLNFSTRLIGRL